MHKVAHVFCFFNLRHLIGKSMLSLSFLKLLWQYIQAESVSRHEPGSPVNAWVLTLIFLLGGILVTTYYIRVPLDQGGHTSDPFCLLLTLSIFWEDTG